MSEKESPKKDSLHEAVRTVQKAIASEHKRYEQIAAGDEESPILVEGNTVTGHYAQTHADPKDIAKILLEYDYAMYRILGDDAPDGMWNDIARLVGFESVSSVDI